MTRGYPYDDDLYGRRRTPVAPKRNLFPFGVKLILLVVWWAWLPLLVLASWGLQKLLFPGMGTWSHEWWKFGNQWTPHIFQADWTAGSSFFLLVGAIGTVAFGLWAFFDHEDPLGEFGGGIVSVLGIVALVVSAIQFGSANWDSDKVAARYYGSATQFIVTDPSSPPAALAKLINGTNKPGNGCALTGPKYHGSDDDVKACIVKGTYSMSGWEPRVSSATGATQFLTRTSGAIAGAKLDTNTIEYLNAHDGKSAQWSAVRDGSNISNPTVGVVEWNGVEPKATSCSFTDNTRAHQSTDDRFNRAIDGTKRNSLPNLLGEKYETLSFNFTDYWGYCDANDHPVLVFPVTHKVKDGPLYVDEPAGVVTARGSVSGDPALKYEPTVKPGEYPGPVYPASIVDSQISSNEWAGGRAIMNNQKFGFEPATSEIQAGNDSDYLLESASDHHLYWVTPLTPHYSDSQLYVSYSVTPADQVVRGKLNTHKIYVVQDNDNRQVNIDQLASQALTYMITAVPGFSSNHGKLVEFTPTTGDYFRAFGEVNGRVAYELDIRADGTSPKLTSLGSAVTGTSTPAPTTSTTTTAPAPSTVIKGSGCNKPATLTNAQIAACLAVLSGELSKRNH